MSTVEGSLVRVIVQFKVTRMHSDGWLSISWSLFGGPIIIRPLIFRVPQKGTIILTTTQISFAFTRVDVLADL